MEAGDAWPAGTDTVLSTWVGLVGRAAYAAPQAGRSAAGSQQRAAGAEGDSGKGTPESPTAKEAEPAFEARSAKSGPEAARHTGFQNLEGVNEVQLRSGQGAMEMTI